MIVGDNVIALPRALRALLIARLASRVCNKHSTVSKRFDDKQADDNYRAIGVKQKN